MKRNTKNGGGLARRIIGQACVFLLASSFMGLASCGSEGDTEVSKKTGAVTKKSTGDQAYPDEVIALPGDENGSSPGITPSGNAVLVFTLRPQQLLNKAGYSGSLMDMIRAVPEIQIPEVLAGLFRDPGSLGIDLKQSIHVFAIQGTTASSFSPSFLCVTAGIEDASLVRGQIGLFALLGMQKSIDGQVTSCSFPKPSLAFAFDARRFALALGLNKEISTKAALAQVQQLFSQTTSANLNLNEHLAESFDLGLYLQPEGASLVPGFLARADPLKLMTGARATTALFKPGEVILSFKHIHPGQNAADSPVDKNITWQASPPEVAASVAIALDGNASQSSARKATRELMKAILPSGAKVSPRQGSDLVAGQWLATWTGASLAKDGSYMAEISLPGEKFDDNDTEEGGSLDGIHFMAQVNCAKAVSLLRSLPEPEPWRYDWVVAFEKLDRLSWSGNFTDSNLQVNWRDKESNGLASLLSLARQSQSEREGAELYAAIAAGDQQALVAAMQNISSDLFEPETGVSPLHFAAWQGRVQMIRYFIGKGLNVDTTDSSGRTPLHAACWSGMAETVRVLLEQNATVDSRNANGATSAMGSARMGHADILDILLESGADLNATDKNGHGLVEYAAAGGRDKIAQALKDRNATIRSPLHVAAGSNDLKGLKKLLAQGLEVDQRDGWGGTALLFAASGGKTETLTYLLKKGADSSISDKLGFTLIHAAAVSGNEKILQRVLDMNPEINPRHQQHGSTPLDWAMARQDAVLSEMLRAKGGKTSWALGAP